MPTLLGETANAPLNSPADFRKSEIDDGQQIRALLVDDDDDYREAAAAELEYFGIKVVSWPSGEEMLASLEQRHHQADVIILDWRLQSGLGIDFLPLLHGRGISLPIVFLTAVPTTAYEYAALDRGAVDFVDKARGIPILAKRLRLIVQLGKGNAMQENQEPIESGKLLLRPDVSRAYWDSTDIDLTVTEFRIVYLLLSRCNEYVTYRSIYDCVHHAGFVAGSGEDGYRTNVRSSIRRIRNKFRAFDGNFEAIENYPGFGYRWRTRRGDAKDDAANEAARESDTV
jgi:two-component system, OmpR family, response regulator ChvI